MESDTKPQNVKCCSRCEETKDFDKFIKKRNLCKECVNKSRKEQYRAIVIDESVDQTCESCDLSKPSSGFVKNKLLCKECNNKKRREKYKNDEDHRQKMIHQASIFKHNKVVEKQKKKLDEIGEGNKKCSWCDEIKPGCNFRYNRLKCRTCERDDPLDKFKRTVRGRIHNALSKKSMNTVKYLGTSSAEYLKWILHNEKNYTLDNRGKEWHIDHVIPLSRFNLENDEEQLIAFNWRNTMPLSPKENLSKNNKIVLSQIEQHYRHLLDYHKEKKIEMPNEFIDLFAKYLAVRETP